MSIYHSFNTALIPALHSASNRFMFPYVAIAAFGLLFGGQYLIKVRRSAAMRSLAAQLGFTYIGGALPRSISLDGTPLDNVTSVWNVIDGERHGIRVIAFDCRIGRGRGSWRRSVIAAQSSADVFHNTVTQSAMTVNRSGAWAILFQPKSSFINIRLLGFMPISDVKAHIEGITA